MSGTVLDAYDGVRPLAWDGDVLQLLDQRRLPDDVQWLRCTDVDAVSQAIGDMVVRGAPAIGVAAAYGVVLAARQYGDDAPALAAALERLGNSRPTAVNLRWALSRMAHLIPAGPATLLDEARRIHAEDLAANRRMGDLGAALISPVDGGLLTHCNTGSLATAGFGTALGVVRAAVARGVVSEVYASETRPWLQGARLTAWELTRDGIPVTLLTDSACAHLMARGKVGWVIVGADRVAANGDVANKIGTYALAVLARHHGVRFMVVAPSSTVDMAVASGAGIPIEERDADEVLGLGGRRIAAQGARAWNPAFDVTPAALVDVLVTECGVIERPDAGGIARLLGKL